MQSEMSRRPGRLKPPEIPTSLDPSASHRDEVRVVLDMLDDIIATTKDVVREEARFMLRTMFTRTLIVTNALILFNREEARVHLRWPE